MHCWLLLERLQGLLYALAELISASVWRHLAAADLGDDGALGSGVGHRGSRAGAGHVRVAPPAVRRHRRPGARAAQDLHHQRRLGGGHHQPAGVSGSDPLSAQRQNGPRGGEADDPRAQVSQRKSLYRACDASTSYGWVVVTMTGMYSKNHAVSNKPRVINEHY